MARAAAAALVLAACARGIDGSDGRQGADGLQGIQGPAGPSGAKGDTGLQGAPGPKGDIGPIGPAGPVVSVYDSTGSRLGALLSLRVDGTSSYPMYRDDAGHVWAWVDSFGTLPAQNVLLFASTDCTGSAFSTQTNVAGLVVRHTSSLYYVGDGSE